MKAPSSSLSRRLPYLLLLPLLAVLLFGNCGSSVRGVLQEMNSGNRAALRASVVQRQVAREAAHQKLHGRARQKAFERIEQIANRQADSILDSSPKFFNESLNKKFHTRRNKLERQLLREYPAPPSK